MTQTTQDLAPEGFHQLTQFLDCPVNKSISKELLQIVCKFLSDVQKSLKSDCLTLRRLFKKLQSCCLPIVSFPHVLLQNDFVQALAKTYDSLLLRDYDKQDVLSTLLELLFLIEDISEHPEGKRVCGKLFVPRLLVLAPVQGTAIKLQRSVVETLCALITKSTENQQAVLNSILDCYKLFKVFLPKCGDFHLQASISEILYRLSRKDAQLLDLINDMTAVKVGIQNLQTIKKPDLVCELRNLVNLLNKSTGSLRSVHSFLAEKITVNGHDATSQEKWIDFGSLHVSFYVIFEGGNNEAHMLDLLYQDITRIHRYSSIELEIVVQEKCSRPYFQQDFADQFGRSSFHLCFSSEGDLSSIISNVIPNIRQLKRHDVKLTVDDRRSPFSLTPPSKSLHSGIGIRKASIGLRVPLQKLNGAATCASPQLLHDVVDVFNTASGRTIAIDDRQQFNVERRETMKVELQRVSWVEKVQSNGRVADVSDPLHNVIDNNFDNTGREKEFNEAAKRSAMAQNMPRNDDRVDVSNPGDDGAQAHIQNEPHTYPPPPRNRASDINLTVDLTNDMEPMLKKVNVLKEKNQDFSTDVFQGYNTINVQSPIDALKRKFSPYEFEQEVTRENGTSSRNKPDLSSHPLANCLNPGSPSDCQLSVLGQAEFIPGKEVIQKKDAKNENISLNEEDACLFKRQRKERLQMKSTNVKSQRTNIFQCPGSGSKRPKSGISDPIETDSDKHQSLLAKSFTPNAQKRVNFARDKLRKQRKPLGPNNFMKTTCESRKIASEGKSGTLSNLWLKSARRNSFNITSGQTTFGISVVAPCKITRNYSQSCSNRARKDTAGKEHEENHEPISLSGGLIDTFKPFSPLAAVPELPATSSSSGKAAFSNEDKGDSESISFEIQKSMYSFTETKPIKVEGCSVFPKTLPFTRRRRHQRCCKNLSSRLSISPFDDQLDVASEIPMSLPTIPSDEEGNACGDAYTAQYEEDSSLDGICKLVRTLLQKFRQKVKVQADGKMKQIVQATSEKTLLEVQAVKGKIQDDIEEYSKVCKQKFQILEVQLKDRKEKSEVLYNKFKNEYEAQFCLWNHLISQMESTKIELMSLADKQKITHKKLLAHAQEVSEQCVAEAEKKLSTVKKTAEDMQGLQFLLSVAAPEL